MRAEELWSCACNGNIAKLKDYYDNGGTKNIRYKAFGTEHSLIAGAYRNKQHNTVNFLISAGETLLPSETKEFWEYVYELGQERMEEILLKGMTVMEKAIKQARVTREGAKND